VPKRIRGVNSKHGRALREPRPASVRGVPPPANAVTIRPRGPLGSRFEVPGSKSLTNRALVAAALAAGDSRIHGALDADDTRVMRNALRSLGVAIEDADPGKWTVAGRAGRLTAPPEALDVRDSGTTARFLAAAACLADGPVVIDGSPRMRERPIGALADALRALGADLEVMGEAECLPLTLRGGGLLGGHIEMDARRSSQYVSAVLLVAPYAERDVILHFAPGSIASRPYVDLTLSVMKTFGADASWLPDPPDEIRVRAGSAYAGRDFAVEGDASSAVYGFCAAAIAGGSVLVPGLARDSLQPDIAVLEVLETMGCTVQGDAGGLRVTGPGDGKLKSPGAIDLDRLPDAALALAVTAAFCDGPTRLRGLGTLRIKESDRLAALETELRRLGAGAEAGPDWLQVQPAALHAASIETYDDHRIAMSFALAGLRIPGIEIRDPGCTAKTWPGFFEALEAL